MGNASKYWNYSKKKPIAPAVDGPLLRNSPEPLHVVTHRAIGDIPGCTPALREYTFKDTTLEEARVITDARASAYAAELTKYVNGEYGGESGLQEMWAAVSMLKPMFGPHGEKI